MLSKKPTGFTPAKGTKISASNLFHNFTQRRNSLKVTEELKHTVEVCKSYALHYSFQKVSIGFWKKSKSKSNSDIGQAMVFKSDVGGISEEDENFEIRAHITIFYSAIKNRYIQQKITNTSKLHFCYRTYRDVTDFVSTHPTKTIWVWRNVVVHNLVLAFHLEF